MQLEGRLENNPLKQLKRDHLVNKIAIGVSVAFEVGALIYSILRKDSQLEKISGYVGSGIAFALTLFGYLSVCRPDAEKIRNCEYNLEHNIYLK